MKALRITKNNIKHRQMVVNGCKLATKSQNMASNLSDQTIRNLNDTIKKLENKIKTLQTEIEGLKANKSK